jgi:hypothetical protein
MSFRDKVRYSLHRWADSIVPSRGVHGGRTSLPDVGDMAGDAVAEADRPEQEREYEEWQAEQETLGRPTDS